MSGVFNAVGLSDAVLEAAASRGLLRRATRDRAAGLVQRRGTEAGAEVLAVDGETVRLGPGGLAGAACTCPSREVCRHMLAAVLELRDGGPIAAASQGDCISCEDPADSLSLRERAGVKEAARAKPGRVESGFRPPVGQPGSHGLPHPGPLPEGEGEGSVATPRSIGLPALAALPPLDALAELAALDAGALVRAFGRAALRRAEAILAEAAVPDGAAEAVLVLPAGASCTVRIAGHPEVHYVAGQGPAGMVSRATDAKALHAAALLAVRRLHAGLPVAMDNEAPAAPAVRAAKGEAAFLEGVAEALWDAARAALASAPAVLEDRLLDFAVSLRADALPNLAGALRGVAADMARRRTGAAGFDSADALAAIARTYALTCALRRDGEDPRLRGEVRGTFVPHAALDLIGCGVALWRMEGGAQGVTAHFAAPDEQGGPRWFSTTLARAAGQDPGFGPHDAAVSDWVWDSTLERLGAEAFRLPAPLVDPDGRLSPRAETRAEPAGLGWAEAVARHPDLTVQDWGGLEASLAGSFAPTLRRRGTAARPVLLRPVALAAPGFDAVAQAATLPVQDRGGAWLELRIGGDDRMDAHLDALAALPDGGAGSVLAVLTRVEAGELVLSPISMCAAPGRPLQHLDLLPARKQGAVPTGLLQRLQDGLALIGWPGTGRGAPRRFVRSTPAAGATARLLAAAADETLALAELGGRMEDAARLDRLRGMARLLEGSGLAILGDALLRLADAPAPERPHHLLVFTHMLACWRRLAPAAPLLTPVA